MQQKGKSLVVATLVAALSSGWFHPIEALAETSCTVRFGVADIVPIGAVEFEVHHRSLAGYFGNELTTPVCRPSIVGANVLVSAACVSGDADCYETGNATISVAVRHPTGVVGPIELVRCEFHSNTEIQSDDFDARLVAISLPGSAASTDHPGVVVTSVDCSKPFDLAENPTTVAEPGETESDDTSDATRFEIAVRVDSGDDVGAIQLEIPYDHISGQFRGSGAAVECKLRTDVNGSGVFFNCDGTISGNRCDDEKRLKVAIVSMERLDLSRPLFSCIYEVESESVQSDLFEVNVVEITDPRAQVLSPARSFEFAVSRVDRDAE